ncbi:MAG: serine hydrolase [Spirochaetota bacterium]
MLKIITKQKPYFEPGTYFYYSNSNYSILGFVLEQIYNKSIQELIENKFIDPLDPHKKYSIATVGNVSSLHSACL